MHVSSQRVRNNSQRGDDGAVATLSELIYHDAFFSHLWPLTSADDTDISPAERERERVKAIIIRFLHFLKKT